VLPKLLDGGGLDGILFSAMITLGLSIRCKDTLQGPPALACAREYCLALSLLRNGLLRADGSLGAELVAASMCLSLAEVGNDPGRKTDIKGSLANDFSIAVFAANLQRRTDGAS
jgi:hypothetical protein